MTWPTKHGSARIIRGNALALPLADASVDLICTSPPYFGLRSYQDGGEHYRGQIGSEATPAEFVDALIAATREMVRVLKPSGSIWVNLGDKYAGGGGQWNKDERPDPGRRRAVSGSIGTGGRTYGLRPKSLIGIPWRYALRCIDDLGLILRAEVIWSKPNGLPESVTDRVRRSHEQWFHFTVQPRYFSAVDEIRERYESTESLKRTKGKSMNGGSASGSPSTNIGVQNSLGKLPGSVWTIPTQPLQVPAALCVDHFAAFPMEWPRRIIQGWSPAGVCTVCGEGRRPVAHAEYVDAGGRGNEKWNRVEQGSGDYVFGSFKPQEMRLGRANRTTIITGYDCACTEPTAATRPSVVLDPFGGTGTTALVAKALGRHGISVDMSADYSRLATWRTNDPGQMAAAMQVEKPAVIPPDQLTLFGGAA